MVISEAVAPGSRMVLPHGLPPTGLDQVRRLDRYRRSTRNVAAASCLTPGVPYGVRSGTGTLSRTASPSWHSWSAWDRAVRLNSGSHGASTSCCRAFGRDTTLVGFSHHLIAAATKHRRTAERHDRRVRSVSSWERSFGPWAKAPWELRDRLWCNRATAGYFSQVAGQLSFLGLTCSVCRFVGWLPRLAGDAADLVAYAADIQAARDRLVSFVSSCATLQWVVAPLDSGQGGRRPRRARVRVPGWWDQPTRRWRVHRGSSQTVDTLNAQHAQAAAAVTKAEVTEHLRRGGDAISWLVASLHAADLAAGTAWSSAWRRLPPGTRTITAPTSRWPRHPTQCRALAYTWSCQGWTLWQRSRRSSILAPLGGPAVSGLACRPPEGRRCPQAEPSTAGRPPMIGTTEPLLATASPVSVRIGILAELGGVRPGRPGSSSGGARSGRIVLGHVGDLLRSAH